MSAFGALWHTKNDNNELVFKVVGNVHTARLGDIGSMALETTQARFGGLIGGVLEGLRVTEGLEAVAIWLGVDRGAD